MRHISGYDVTVIVFGAVTIVIALINLMVYIADKFSDKNNRPSQGILYTLILRCLFWRVNDRSALLCVVTYHIFQANVCDAANSSNVRLALD